MLAAALAAALFALVPVQADDALVEAADALRSDAVYVDPDAERALTDAEADEVRARVEDAGVAVFVAVLPASVAPDEASASALPRELEAATELAGEYAVVVGDRFRAESGEAASAAFQAASDDGTAAVLLRYVDEVASGRGRVLGGEDTTEPADDDDGASWLPVGLLAAGGVGAVALLRRRRRREQAQAAAELAADTELLRAELSVLADDVLRLEPDVVLHPDARADYDAAVSRHRAASAALDYADEPIDLVRVDRVVAEARYAMSRARAIVAGQEPPPPPPELRRPGRHDEPPIDLDEQGTPVYVGAGPFYGGGWFGAGGGLFSGLLLGSMLGGWGWGGGWGGGDVYIDNDGGGFGDGGFGDIGGGDFGGDIGGGDW